MIEEPHGCIDYGECGIGQAMCWCEDRAAPAPHGGRVIATWNDQFHCVTTSLLGYGGTVERRIASDPDIAYEAEMLEAIVRKAGSRAHLVGHSFVGFVPLTTPIESR